MCMCMCVSVSQSAVRLYMHMRVYVRECVSINYECAFLHVYVCECT